MNYRSLVTVAILSFTLPFLCAQRSGAGGRPPTREHTVKQSKGISNLVKANKKAPTSTVTIKIEGKYRVIRSNGLPEHRVGKFPNAGNPNSLSPQSHAYRIPLNPKVSSKATPLSMQLFGIAVNGVPFDPSAAEWYLGTRDSTWQYEALSGAVALGVDENHAHVQPTGAYHYHGVPTLLLEELDTKNSKHSPLIGWAADGFPIYALYGYSDSDNRTSKIKEFKSSYRVKSGSRPSGTGNPGGTYDGTFLADFEYVHGLGDLDECNGRITVTPEFPEGTYAYFITNDWPVIPRYYRGTPSQDFERRGGGNRSFNENSSGRYMHPPHEGAHPPHPPPHRRR